MQGRRQRLVVLVALLLGGLGAVVGSTGVASAIAIDTAGPLTRVEITPDLNCAVNHVGDAVGEFYQDTACGTLIATGGTLYGPANIPAGSAASPRTPFTPVSQVSSGSGTSAAPFTIVTVVDAGPSGLRLTQTDSYVVGQESYRTDVQVTNTAASPATAALYKAGDCFLQESDDGFGAYDGATGAISCVGVDQNGTGPGPRIEQFLPLTAGSSYLEDRYSSVWAAVGSQLPFANQCAACPGLDDNGIGLSWNLTLPAQGSTTISHFTTFSPLGIVPLRTTKTADSATSAPGAANGYTISIANPNGTTANLDSVTDTLPAGFTHVAGSTTGATTANPIVSGQVLTWTGPFAVPAGGTLTLHLGVTVSQVPGVYLNEAGAASSSLAVAPTGPTAAVTVTGASAQAPPVAADQTVVALQNTAKLVTLTASDPNGDALTYAIASPPANGTLSGSGANLTYTPAPGFTGTDTFTFTASDGTATSNVATVTIQVATIVDVPLVPVESLPITGGALLLIALGLRRRSRRQAGIRPAGS